MKKVVSAAVICTACAAAVFAAVPFYDMDLSVSPDQGTVKGTVRITLAAGTGSGQAIYLRLLLNNGEKPNPKLFPFFEAGSGPEGFSPSFAQISDLTVNGTASAVTYTKAPLYATNYNLESMFVRIDLAAARTQAPAVIAFHYEVQLPHKKYPDDFHFDDKMISRFGWFPFIASEDELGALVFEPFTFHARLSLSEGWDMARLGTSFAGEAGRIEVESTTPVASFSLVFLKGYKRYSVGWLKDQKVLDVLYRPTAEDAAHLISAYAREALEYYAERYVPYEARYVSVVQNNPGAYGMAADSVVLLGDGVFGGLNRVIPGLFARPLEYTVDHEIGHLYWGIGAPIDFLSENYLSEGLNEFSTLGWYEQKYGRWDNLYAPQADLVGQEYLRLAGELIGHSYASQKFRSVFAIHAMGWDEPLSGPRPKKIDNAQQSTDYDKSWFVLSMLGRYVGRDLLQRALGDFARQYRYRPYSSRDLEAFLTERTGRDVSAFFAAFIYGTKSLDYELSGLLNERSQDSYESRLRVRDKGDAGIFVPTTLTAFLQDGTTKELPVDAPGEYALQTASPIVYAGVDKDAENLDYDRKNNFWPRSIVPAQGTDYWLLDGAADKIYVSAIPYVGTEQATAATDIGTGLTLSDTLTYSLSVNVFGSLPADTTALNQYGYGVALAGSLTPSSDTFVGLRAVYRYPTTISSVELTGMRTVYLPIDIGSASRFYYPSIALSGSVSLNGIDVTVPATGFLAGQTAFTLDAVPKIGTMLALVNTIRWHWGSGALEDRVSVDVAQAIPFFRTTLLGVELKASAGFGDLVSLNASNAALGIDSTGPGAYAYDARARAFLGVPLLNYLDIAVANLVVLQSVNLAFVYEAGAAFNAPAEIPAAVQTAVGIELLPVLRTAGDATFGLAIGMSFDLNAIVAMPGSPSSYVPTVYVDLSILPSLFNSVMPY